MKLGSRNPRPGGESSAGPRGRTKLNRQAGTPAGINTAAPGPASADGEDGPNGHRHLDPGAIRIGARPPALGLVTGGTTRELEIRSPRSLVWPGVYSAANHCPPDNSDLDSGHRKRRRTGADILHSAGLQQAGERMGLVVCDPALHRRGNWSWRTRWCRPLFGAGSTSGKFGPPRRCHHRRTRRTVTDQLLQKMRSALGLSAFRQERFRPHPKPNRPTPRTEHHEHGLPPHHRSHRSPFCIRLRSPTS